MLVSYNWLQDFLDLDIDPKDLAEKITRTGVEIESVAHPEEGLKKLVVGHILECEDIEGTHLHKCLVDVGEEEPIQIVVVLLTLRQVKTSLLPYTEQELLVIIRLSVEKFAELNQTE